MKDTCRTCRCHISWHVSNGKCCYYNNLLFRDSVVDAAWDGCMKYAPSDNLEYLESLVDEK